MTEEEVDDLIDRWHDGEGANMSLNEWLGWTWDEYGAWLEKRIPAEELPTREVNRD